MDIAEHDRLANRKGVPFAVADGYRSAIREIERLRRALQQFADNQLSDENCASVDVAAKRIRGIARVALRD